MKALACADKHGFPRHVAHQVYYSLLNRDYEWELMPLGIDQGIGAVSGVRSAGAGSLAASAATARHRRDA
jgi:aryl-alcohol dehydrogenase-like predicted oxidoreductase